MKALFGNVVRFAPVIVLVPALAGCGPEPGPELPWGDWRPGNGRFFIYAVRIGDTLWSLARKFETTVAELVDLNRIDPEARLEVGDELRIPIPLAKTLLPRVAARGWMWPVEGKTVVRFGDKKGGLKAWGIDIRVRRGAAIVAAGGGVVRKAGPFVGLGSTVVIEHDGGRTVTMYGRNGSLLVKEGDIVKKGQKIAVVPEVFDRDPVVHFRMYKKGVPVDPEAHLP